ncbi:sugar transferase [Phycisphaerales bacterium AB-hyl4]|uniref:Sugar transferase n=1 Tax=Natronomicrosphaera hydrolytica TaxID=3242702 RepID=A0ABV4U3T3_9BACT
MRAILDRERARSDRNARGFAVVLFDLASKADRQQWRCLTQVVTCNVRLTDEVGWLDGRLAALLPETDGTGGDRLVERVRDRLGRKVAEFLRYEIVVYGFDGNDHEDGDRYNQREPAVPIPAWADEVVDDAFASARAVLFVQSLAWWKRLVDVLVASTVLVTLFPVMLIVAILIKATSPGPVVFVQWRAGLGGRPFRMYKFRSMVADAEVRKQALMSLNEQDGPAFKIEADPRLTSVGRFLRSTSLDELPQLWNVLRGEMTLVGPRPLPCEEARRCEPWHQARCDVTPGLTCSWQVWGRSSVTFEQWMRMDLAYIRQRTPLHDFKLLFHTAAAVLARRGAK